MTKQIANFPTASWDGLSGNNQRPDRVADQNPNFEDWDQMVSEVLAMQDSILNGPLPLSVVSVGLASAPAASVDSFKMYAADITAGNAAPHFKTEAGDVVALYKHAIVAAPTGGATVDAESRTAIDGIRTLLIDLGLMSAT